MKHRRMKSSFISLVILAIVLALIAFPVAVTAAPAEPDVGLDRSVVCDFEQQSIKAKTASVNLDDLDYGKNATGLAPAIYDDTLAAAGNPDDFIGMRNSMLGTATSPPAYMITEVMRVGVMSAGIKTGGAWPTGGGWDEAASVVRQGGTNWAALWPNGGGERDISAGGYVITPPAMAFNKKTDYGLGKHAWG